MICCLYHYIQIQYKNYHSIILEELMKIKKNIYGKHDDHGNCNFCSTSSHKTNLEISNLTNSILKKKHYMQQINAFNLFAVNGFFEKQKTLQAINLNQVRMFYDGNEYLKQCYSLKQVAMNIKNIVLQRLKNDFIKTVPYGTEQYQLMFYHSLQKKRIALHKVKSQKWNKNTGSSKSTKQYDEKPNLQVSNTQQKQSLKQALICKKHDRSIEQLQKWTRYLSKITKKCANNQGVKNLLDQLQMNSKPILDQKASIKLFESKIQRDFSAILPIKLKKRSKPKLDVFDSEQAYGLQDIKKKHIKKHIEIKSKKQIPKVQMSKCPLTPKPRSYYGSQSPKMTGSGAFNLSSNRSSRNKIKSCKKEQVTVLKKNKSTTKIKKH